MTEQPSTDPRDVAFHDLDPADLPLTLILCDQGTRKERWRVVIDSLPVAVRIPSKHEINGGRPLLTIALGPRLFLELPGPDD